MRDSGCLQTWLSREITMLAFHAVARCKPLRQHAARKKKQDEQYRRPNPPHLRSCLHCRHSCLHSIEVMNRGLDPPECEVRHHRDLWHHKGTKTQQKNRSQKNNRKRTKSAMPPLSKKTN